MQGGLHGEGPATEQDEHLLYVHFSCEEEHPYRDLHVADGGLVHHSAENVPVSGELLHAGLVLRMAGGSAIRCGKGADLRGGSEAEHRRATTNVV